MSDTTPRASEDEPTPLADETARELNTGEQLVQPSPDPADHTDTAAVAPLPPDYRPVSASDHVAPEPAVPSAAPAEAAPATPAAASADDAQLAAPPADPTDPQQHTAAVAAAAAEPDESASSAAASATEAEPVAEPAPAPVTESAPVAEPEPAPAPVAEPTAATTAAPETPAPAPYAGATYITAPTPPKKKSNRGLGILIAVLGVVVFAAANLAATLGILTARYSFSQAQTDIVSYVEGWEFWVPVAVFAAAFIALVAIVNRGRWWGYILGSMFVAALVFIAYFGAALLTNRIWERTPAQARTFAGAYFETNIPYLWVAVAATFIALEVVTWLGGWIAFHGQRAKARYAEARAAYDAEHAADR